jgi:hypothetical protein
VFVHQAESATIHAGGGGSQLTGIQFVDDGHVPHNPNNAYFVDRYGARQHVLTLNRADYGTMMGEFPLIDARVTTGKFHLGTQVLTGIQVGANGGGAAPGAANSLATGGAQAGAQQTAQAAGCGAEWLQHAAVGEHPGLQTRRQDPPGTGQHHERYNLGHRAGQCRERCG